MSERISITPDVCNGRPVIRGTRAAVQTVLEFLAAGDSIEDVLEEYPISPDHPRRRAGVPGLRLARDG